MKIPIKEEGNLKFKHFLLKIKILMKKKMSSLKVKKAETFQKRKTQKSK